MYYDFTVPVPQIQGKILQKSKGTATYVMYQYGSVYANCRGLDLM